MVGLGWGEVILDGVSLPNGVGVLGEIVYKAR